MLPYLLISLTGFAGSFHCLGMCSGFACAMGTDPRGRFATVRRHIIYNTGRVSVYCFLGAVAGSLGATLILHASDNMVLSAQRLLAFASGALMIMIGLQIAGYFKRRYGALGSGSHLLVQAMRDLLKIPSPVMPLAFGVFNGFLPCPLVYAFVAQAAASGGTLSGLLIMAAFGFGTFPAMLLAGKIGTRLSLDWRFRGVRIAGLCIVIVGLMTLVRGVVPLGDHGSSSLLKALSWCSNLIPYELHSLPPAGP